MTFFAIVDAAGLVKAAIESTEGPAKLGPGLRAVEIDEAVYRAVLAQPKIDDSLPAWRVDDKDAVTAAEDPRPLLTITVPAIVAAGFQPVITFEYTDPSPQTLVIAADGRRVAIDLVDGRATVTRPFPVGPHVISSASPGEYRCVGGKFEVIENWTSN